MVMTVKNGGVINMKILVLGATGMVGHVIAIYLNEQGHEVTALSRRYFPYTKNIIGEVTNLSFLEKTIKKGDFDVIINCIGVLNQNAEENKHQAVFLNSFLPHFLSDLTKDLKIKVIHISTDYVFSGKGGNYNENSFKDGEAFYDRTKSLGELDNSKDLTFRNSIIGPDINEGGRGLFNWFMNQHGEINGYTKVMWTGVTTITLAKAIERALEENLIGLYNLVNNKSISKLDLLMLINDYMKDNSVKIIGSDIVVSDRSLINSRDDFSFVVPSYKEMIIEMKRWIIDHKEIYTHYFK